MNVWQAMLLGAVQGATEFLPVSSSGHMLLIRRLIGIEAGMMFDVMMHVGTLVAVCAVFRRELIALFRPPFLRLGLVALASVPAGLAGVLLSDEIDKVFGGGQWLFITFALSAALVLATRRIAHAREIRGMAGRDVGIAEAAAMGAAQAVALLPGLSRSAATTFGGIAAGADREKAVSFAFVMSVPVILGSALLGASGGLSGGAGALPTFVGAATACAVGIPSAKLARFAIGRAASVPMAAYLIALSLLSLALNIV